MTLRRFALVLILLLVAWGLRTLWLAGAFLTLEPHFEGSCVTVAGVAGPEDLTIHPERPVAYVSSYDRAAVARGAPGGGALYAYGLDREPGPLVNLTPRADPDFRPHGLSLWRGEDGRERLFVIDHAGGKHAVSIYAVKGETLEWLSTVRHPLMSSPNDVVAVGPDRFYATNDHRYRDGIGRTLEDWLRLPLANVVYWDGAQMVEAADGIAFANGINASADGGTVYVASVFRREVRAYDRDPETGSLDLRERIFLGSPPDNVEVDEEGALWIGAHPKLLQLRAHIAGEERYAPSQILRARHQDGAWQIDEIYLDTGEAISAASVGAARNRRLLIGAIHGTRFLDCQLPHPP